MMNFDDSFQEFFESIEYQETKIDNNENDSLTVNVKYRGRKRFSFKEIPEGLIKTLAVDTGIYEFHCNVELPDKIISKYNLKRV